ncbi:MAG: copper chaperone PCu(A)C [Roseinatronobacter sp.]
MKALFFPAALAASLAVPALACDTVEILDPFARASTAMSQSGAAFMTLVNPGPGACRVIEARSDIAERIELHTHIEDADGVMRMVEVEEGFTIPAGGTHALERGGDHVMFLGLTQSLAQGDEISLTLVFEDGTELTSIVPVDLERMGAHGHGHSHDHGHSHSHSHSHSHGN